jgi:crotonobetainyl-CoA:carnitine CoA-transferase CaiB-like acyl-CoA transferase
MTAALYGAIAILGALRQREVTGEGQKLDVPLFESTVALMGYWLAYTQAYDAVPEPLGAGHPNWSPYDVFRTRDGSWVFVGPSSQRQWEVMCEALDIDLHEDEQFATLEARREHAEELDALLDAEFRTYDPEDLLVRLRSAGVPAAPVNDTRAVRADPHLDATDALAEVETVEGRSSRIWIPRFPVLATGFDRIETTDPPRLGADTDAVLAELGYSPAEVEELREQGVI